MNNKLIISTVFLFIITLLIVIVCIFYMEKMDNQVKQLNRNIEEYELKYNQAEKELKDIDHRKEQIQSYIDSDSIKIQGIEGKEFIQKKKNEKEFFVIRNNSIDEDILFLSRKLSEDDEIK